MALTSRQAASYDSSYDSYGYGAVLFLVHTCNKSEFLFHNDRVLEVVLMASHRMTVKET